MVTLSAQEGAGVDELWAYIMESAASRRKDGSLELRRRRQRRIWLWDELEVKLLERFKAQPDVIRSLDGVEAAVIDGKLTVSEASAQLLSLLKF